MDVIDHFISTNVSISLYIQFM